MATTAHPAGATPRSGAPRRTRDAPPAQNGTGRALPAVDEPFLTQLSFDPTGARFFEEIDRVFAVTPEERDGLRRNGFVVSDRVAFPDFTTAYAYLYWKDLPVLITTDSILHAMHEPYVTLVRDLEASVLAPRLLALLSRCQEQLA